MSIQDIYSPVSGELLRVEEMLARETRWPGGRHAGSVEAIIKAGGKRLRPALMLMSAKAGGYTGERVIGLAVALELVHTASLVHDDVIDNAATRRGVPTANSLAGNRFSVLMGDYLLSRVVGILAEDGDAEVTRTFAEATTEMVGGEMLQTCLRDEHTVTESDYFSVIARKTASLMSCSCRVGALLCGSGNGHVDLMTGYGSDLGMAFQITDDLLDLTGREEELGKAVGNDVREGRITLPFIRALSVADGSDRDLILTAFRSCEATNGDLERLKDIVLHYDGIGYSRRKAAEYSETCKRQLAALDDSESRRSLLMLADYVVDRAS